MRAPQSMLLTFAKSHADILALLRLWTGMKIQETLDTEQCMKVFSETIAQGINMPEHCPGTQKRQMQSKADTLLKMSHRPGKDLGFGTAHASYWFWKLGREFFLQMLLSDFSMWLTKETNKSGGSHEADMVENDSSIFSAKQQSWTLRTTDFWGHLYTVVSDSQEFPPGRCLLGSGGVMCYVWCKVFVSPRHTYWVCMSKNMLFSVFHVLSYAFLCVWITKSGCVERIHWLHDAAVLIQFAAAS